MLSKRGGLIAVVLTLVVLLLAATGCDQKNDKLVIGTGGVGGNYYQYGTNLAKSIREKSEGKVEVTATAGSAANLRLISEGYVDMALVQADTLSDALNGEGAFSEGALKGFHIVTGLFAESFQVITKKDAGIATLYDLKNHRISVGEKDSGTERNALQLLRAYGIPETAVTVKQLSFADSADALEKNEIDAFFVTASAPTTAIKELAEKCDIQVLSLDSSVIRSLVGEGSIISEITIPAGTYKGQTEEVLTAGVNAVLIASDKVPSETEAMVVSILKEQNEHLQEISFGIHATEPEKEKTTPVVPLDMFETLGLAVVILFLGMFLRKRIHFLEKFCIPAPVIGGLIFAIISCILYATHLVEISFDETLKNVCMIIFFTTVGFQANLKVLKKGGIRLLLFLGVVVVLIVSQNGIAIGLSKLLKISPLIGMCTGSIPMVGGHGTAGAFGQVLEDLGQTGATTLCTAAATFGLIAGSLIGGPIGRRLIEKKNLLKTAVPTEEKKVEAEIKEKKTLGTYAPAVYQLAIAMGIGSVVSLLLSKTGMTFPVYIGSMIVAAVIRNIGEYSKKYEVPMEEIGDIGSVCLNLFLGIAMITLKLWQLADLALPLIVLLVAQVLFMALFAYFVVFNVMGRKYDSAVLSAGTCGFGLGATPNAMANMQALTDKYLPSVEAYLLVPIVGSMFADFINSIVITFFINIL